MGAPEGFSDANQEIVEKGLPCDDCGSSDAKALYGDGHTHCYSCGKTRKGKADALLLDRPRPAVASSTGLIPMSAIRFAPIKSRRLEQRTTSRFQYGVTTFKGETVEVAHYFAPDGTIACQKLRLPNKEFVVLKAPNAAAIGDCQLFGRPVWGDKHDRRVVILEGEHDAMACAQATDFKYPCVSVSSGAKGAAKSLKANYLWLDRFQEIILWYDQDDKGQAAIEECVNLFAVGKVRVARMPT